MPADAKIASSLVTLNVRNALQKVGKLKNGELSKHWCSLAVYNNSETLLLATLTQLAYVRKRCVTINAGTEDEIDAFHLLTWWKQH